MKIKNKRRLAAGLAIAGLALGFYVNNQCFVAREKDIRITSAKVDEPIKITQISDFHSNVLKNLDETIANIKDFDPDFIVLTGDIIDYGTDKKIERSVYFLKHLMTLGKDTYYITGNHEEGGPNLSKFLNEIDRLGIIYLNNEGKELEIKGQKVYLYGTGMYNFSLESYKPSNDSLNIILSHFSKNIRDNYRDDIDLVLSGHTHGGQVRAPIIGGLIAPGEGIFPDYDKGIYKFKNSVIYVDSGLGNTFLPLRILDPIGYSNITIAPVV